MKKLLYRATECAIVAVVLTAWGCVVAWEWIDGLGRPYMEGG